jgi:LCP family protein required for cell wall assembly
MAWKTETGGYEKINALHAYAEQDHPGEGARRTADALSQFFGVPIDHEIRIDFRGFSELIDAVGGIDVNVERSFTDEQYPTSDDLWTTISFKKGMQHMSGQTALVFVRSRHGNNGEGSDFARSKRQQLVLMALRDRLLSLNTLSDPGKLARLYSTLASHIQTDLTPWDALSFAPLISDFDSSRVTTHVLTDAPDGELVATNDGNYLLFPRGGSWDAIKALAQHPFGTDEGSASSTPKLAKVEVKNGTLRTGFAAEASTHLTLDGFNAVNSGNSVRRGYARTLIFDLTGGKKPDDLSKLRSELNADVSLSDIATTTLSNGSQGRFVYAEAMSKESITSSDTDFLVILGESAYSFVDTTSSYALRENP